MSPSLPPDASPPPGSKGPVAALSTVTTQAEIAHGLVPGTPRPQVEGYEVMAELGRGGMGVVYQARQVGLNRLVALKMILQAEQAGTSERERFRREAEAIARLRHPHIVQIYEVGEASGQPYFSLELIEGGNLRDRTNGTPVEPRAAARLMETLARAVHQAHIHGIIHRDLKPGNVLLVEGPNTPLELCTPKLTDFGLAKRIGTSAGQTQSGAVMGTPSYMAPEQARGANWSVGPATDVYSLGAVLYELLTGRPPFLAATTVDTILQVISDDPVSPRRLQPRVPADLETICLKCLHKSPHRRYGSAEALAEDLRRFQALEPIAARPTPPWERAWKWARRRPAIAALTLVSVLAGLVLLIGGLVANAWLRAALELAENRRLAAVASEVDARRHEQIAGEQRRKAEEGEREANGRRREADEQRWLAESNLGAARQAVNQVLQLDQVLTEVQALARASRGQSTDTPLLEQALQEQVAEQALAFHVGLWQKNPNDLAAKLDAARAYRRVGDVRQFIGQHEKAATAYEQAAALFEEVIRAGTPDRAARSELATCWQNLGTVQQGLGRLAEAGTQFQRALDLREQLHKETPKDAEDARALAAASTSLGMLHDVRGKPHEAEPLFRKSLELRRGALAEDHPEVTAAVRNLAETHRQTGAIDKAVALYRSRLQVIEKELGPEHLEVARTLHGLGTLHLSASQVDAAEPILQRALTVWTKHPEHPDLARTLDSLARLALVRGQAQKAEPLVQRSIRVLQATLGPDHLEVAAAYAGLAQLHASQEQWTEAAEATDRSQNILRRHVTRVLPRLPEGDQLAFLRTHHEPAFHRALALALARRDDPAIARLSAGWVLNGKAVAIRALVQQSQLARSPRGTQSGELIQRLLASRRQLGALSALSQPSPEQLTQLTRLVRQEEELMEQLGLAGSPRVTGDPPAELDAVQQALPADAVLIEIVRLPVLDMRKLTGDDTWLPARYVAWLIPASKMGRVEVIDLGLSTEIESGVSQLLNALNHSLDALVKLGERQAVRELEAPMAAMARLALAPLRTRAIESKRWLVSPDGSLWLVPWAALPLADDRFAIEAHAISYLNSGRDLVGTRANLRTGPPVVMANPSYSIKLGSLLAEPSYPPLLSDVLPRKLQRVQFLSLQNTETEGRQVAQLMANICALSANLYVRHQARESVLRSLHSPRMLHLSTHGAYLEDSWWSAGEALPENPLKRSLVALAGANHRGASRPGEEDGLMTGLEVANLDLRGTELVTLCVCETAVGVVRPGEGVASLQQAFHLAGARTVVSALWEIPDREAGELIVDFFARLAQGRGKADALREAQLAMIRKRREFYGAAHPSFWAAFTLSGAWQ